MKHNLEISVFKIIGSPMCVASGDGQKIYDRLEVALIEKKAVTISFLNVTIVTSAFLNAAIGQLYGKFNDAEIRELIKVEDMQQGDLDLLKRVVETAKIYFADPDKFNKAVTGHNSND